MTIPRTRPRPPSMCRSNVCGREKAQLEALRHEAEVQELKDQIEQHKEDVRIAKEKHDAAQKAFEEEQRLRQEEENKRKRKRVAKAKCYATHLLHTHFTVSLDPIPCCFTPPPHMLPTICPTLHFYLLACLHCTTAHHLLSICTG